MLQQRLAVARAAAVLCAWIGALAATASTTPDCRSPSERPITGSPIDWAPRHLSGAARVAITALTAVAARTALGALGALGAIAAVAALAAFAAFAALAAMAAVAPVAAVAALAAFTTRFALGALFALATLAARVALVACVALTSRHAAGGHATTLPAFRASPRTAATAPPA
jgi:hypothetical protein